MEMQKEIPLYPDQTKAMSTRMDILDNQISLKVSSNDVINSINISTEGIQIDGDKVQISGTTTFSQFKNSIENDVAASYATKVAAMGDEQRIYYRSNKSSAPTSAPQSWVTESGNKWNTNQTDNTGWSRKVTAIANGTGSSATKYLYLYTCVQTKDANGNWKANGPITLDETTTVIDGGTIIAGSITANRLATNVLTIGNFSSSDQAEMRNSTYIQADGSNGIKVHAANNVDTNYTAINSSGMQVYKGGTQVASFGDTISLVTSTGGLTITKPGTSNRTLSIGFNSDNINSLSLTNSTGTGSSRLVLGDNAAYLVTGNNRINIDSNGIDFVLSSSNKLTIDSNGVDIYGSLQVHSSNFYYGSGTDPIGYVYSTSGTVTLTNSTTADAVVATAVLGAGKWLVCYNASFAGNKNGLRKISLYKDGTGQADTVIQVFSGMSSSVRLGSAAYVNITSSVVDVDLCASQNSGGTLSVSGYLRCIKIG